MTTSQEPVTTTNIVALYTAGRRYFQKADLSGANMGRADMMEVLNLTKSDLVELISLTPTLMEINLNEADLSDADLSLLSSWPVDLSGANVEGATLLGPTF